MWGGEECESFLEDREISFVLRLCHIVWYSLNIFHVGMKYVNQSLCYSDVHLPFIIFFQKKKYDTYTEKYPSLA